MKSQVFPTLFVQLQMCNKNLLHQIDSLHIKSATIGQTIGQRTIVAFLENQNMLDDFNEITTIQWKQQLYFLCDITSHLSDLNLKLQGPNKFIWDLSKIIQEFKLKLTAFKSQINENDFTFFPKLLENQENEEVMDDMGYNTSFFVDFLEY